MKPHSCHQRKPLPLKGYKNPHRPDDARRLGILLVLFVSLLLNSCNTQDPLTQEERKWLNEHDGKIIVNNEAGWPPIIDIDEKGIPFGIVIDYQALIEKKLNFKFQLDKPDNWDNFMARFRAGKIHVNNNLQKNFEREQYALFTKPYIKIPNVIIVRKDNNKQLTLDQMQGMKIAVTKNFAVHNHMQSNFDDLQLIPLPNERCPHCVYSKMLQGKKETAHVSVELKNKIFHVSNSPINHANGRTSKLTVYRDITETKVMEVRLQQAQKMEAIGTLAGGIAHDFNNILFPIVGHTEMLLEDFPENNPLRDSLNEIYSGAMRARDLVKQILTFSRQEKNELKLIKLQPIVKEALKMIRSTIPTSISIHQNLESTCGAVKADPTQIHQIVMNLATNAYHAMEKNGEELKIFLRQLELEKDDLISMEKMVLQRLGYHVTARTSSIEALEAFRAGTDKFDMVITDMAMPKMPGDTLALELIKIRKDIPVILCTGFSETMNEEQLAARGIAGLLLKPIISKDLAEKIRNIFDGSKNV